MIFQRSWGLCKWSFKAPLTAPPSVDAGAGRAYPCRIMRRDLGDGLVMRRATEADADRLGEFNADVLRAQDAPDPAPWMGAWTRDLISGRHPTFRADSALVVEDTRAKSIVSSMVLLSHTWAYGGVPVSVGQPEIVGTRAEFRGRGLVRAMFDVAHAWSAARGHRLLAINGIPWFYRQFGYEMALELGGGPRLYTPGLAAGVRQTQPPYRVRPATDADAPFLAAKSELGLLDFWLLGSAHPFAGVVQFAGARRPYAYYLRTPDLPTLLRRLTPVLELRLAESALVGHTGELGLSFYRNGVRLVLDGGRIKSVEAWPPPRTVAGLDFSLPSADPRRPSAMFPDLTFLQLLFGHRSLDELEAAFPDCVTRGQEVRALLQVLFPKAPSKVWPIL